MGSGSSRLAGELNQPAESPSRLDTADHMAPARQDDRGDTDGGRRHASHNAGRSGAGEGPGAGVPVGQQDMVSAIDAVCAQASRIIGRLQEGGCGTCQQQ